MPSEATNLDMFLRWRQWRILRGPGHQASLLEVLGLCLYKGKNEVKSEGCHPTGCVPGGPHVILGVDAYCAGSILTSGPTALPQATGYGHAGTECMGNPEQ